MSFFNGPLSYRLANPLSFQTNFFNTSSQNVFGGEPLPPHSSHPPFGHLILLVFEAVLEVVCVSLPGYIVARQGMFDAESQKFLANLNVQLFTPCLIFTKLASQLTADKLIELAVIPVIFIIQTLVSYGCALGLSKVFRFEKRPSNFVIAMGVFGNSNSLPISLVISLSKTISGLHWDQIPGDNDEEVGARGILYLLIFQQLGQLLRWSWGYHVLLAPPEKFEDEDQQANLAIENGEGRYHDDPDSDDEHLTRESEGSHHANGNGHKASDDDVLVDTSTSKGAPSQAGSSFESGGQTPVNQHPYPSSVSSSAASSVNGEQAEPGAAPEILPTPANGNVLPHSGSSGPITSFPRIRSPSQSEHDDPEGIKGWPSRIRRRMSQGQAAVGRKRSAAFKSISNKSSQLFQKLPVPVKKGLSMTGRGLQRFGHGLWEFMNPPLWAMLVAIIVASIPQLQRLFFTNGTFINNSVTRAVSQSGSVAVPLILVVLGANLARNTLPQDPYRARKEEKIETKLLVAALIGRMLLPTIIMAPMLALAAKYVPVSILDDPIFVIVCFLLTGAPSALQLAQICQINGVYEGVMSKLLFQSYVIWILPSTLILVMCALEVVEWAAY
ncbi:MAG: hypothetical protein M4579_002710 [Chaenotheca gracillima]|nr:MAG: hypothetical protein M4579_002710 [Chaenotheca gracillima]